MIGSLIGAGLGLAGSIFGGISASKAMRARMRQLKAQQRENEDWYNRRYNEDSTQRADAQRVLSMTAESIRRRNRSAAGRAAVMGGTDASAASEKEANAKAMADAASQIAAQGEARKDSIEQQYMKRKNELSGEIADMRMQKAAAMGQAVGGAVSALGQAGSAFDDWRDEKKNGNNGSEGGSV